MTTQTHVTLDQYTALSLAFDHFNRHLFDGALPPLMITLTRKANSRGYYVAAKYEARDHTGTTAELALNPDTFRGQTDKQVLSTLAREMVSHWQAANGTAPRKAYKDRPWAEKMQAIGLQPTADGTPTGAQTGQNVQHFIIEGGLFDAACDLFLSEIGQAIGWQSVATPEARKSSKHKFTCPACGVNCWGAPTIRVACMACDLPMDPA